MGSGVFTGVNNDEVWVPGVDPHAETQAAWPAGAGQSVPQQARGGSAPDLGETLYAPGPLGMQDLMQGDGGSGGGRVRGSLGRRRMLFAAGGFMLLAGGGVAAAAVGAGRQSPKAGSSPVGGVTGSPSHPASGATSPGASSTSAAGSTSASTSASSSASSSSSGSPSTSSSGSPGTQVAKAPQWYVDNDGPMAIALTMDDGPDPVYTPKVLEIFEQYGIKATFNMIGQHVNSNLSLVREVSAAGHTITNHTWDHADLTHYTFSQVCGQIDECNDALANANQHPTIFRAPYGNWSKAVFQACAARDLRPVGWSVDPRDWDTEHVTTAQIVQNVMSHTHAHDIILEHDGGGDRAHTVAALKIFIPELLNKGFNFVAM